MSLFDVNIYKDTQIEANSIFEIFQWVIPFVFGLLSSFIIDKVRKSIKIKSQKKFILNYLKKDLLPDCQTLKSEYLKIKTRVDKDNFQCQKILTFEAFNTKVIGSIDYHDYYTIFNKKTKIIIQINSIIEFLMTEMPFSLNNDYQKSVETHLKEEGKLLQDLHSCKYCQELKTQINQTLDLRINETTSLIKLINEL